MLDFHQPSEIENQKLHWLFHPARPIDPALASAIGGHPLVTELLMQRGLTTPAAAIAFLNPDRYSPSPATALPDLEQAADRLYRAITRSEKIAVWGDFDADGQTATTLLVSLLRDLRAEVAYYIPNRLTESHGIKIDPLNRLIDQHIHVLLTCDTGIAELEAIAHAKAHGLTVLVTDHHDLPGELPRADALINPKRLPVDHPLRSLPGVGVAFKLAQHVLQLAGEDERANDYLDLVALGIVADVAELTADTRYLLQRGLDRLRHMTRLGLQTLMTFAKIDATNLTAEHIGFGLGPRLNALGRLGDANLAVELLTTTDLTRARILASQLEGLNNQRKLLMDQIYSAAQDMIAKDASLLDDAALVLSSPHWHSGVIGPVANRLAEQYERPAVLLVTDEAGIARGSARSSPGVDITTALRMCQTYLNNIGGHPGAAGLSLPIDNIPIFRRALSKAIDSIRDKTAIQHGLTIDAELPLDRVTLELAAELERLAPFGEGNPPVTLATRNVTIEHARTFGRKGEHRAMIVADERGHTQPMNWWRGAEADLPAGRFDVAYTIKSTDYRGEPALSIEWIGYQIVLTPSVAIAAPTARIEIVDWRSKDLARVSFEDLRAQLKSTQDFIVWADGPSAAPFPVTRRYDLAEADTLVVWSAPCGWRELSYAIERVKPKTLYLCSVDEMEDRFEPLMTRLAGLLKHDLNRREGHVDVVRLAAALGQRLSTARKGIEWLEAEGEVRVVEWREDHVVIARGDGQKSDEAEAIRSELHVLLSETAAWRAYYRRMTVEQIGQLGNG
jgi:single-stranded-DNA-specific exonuclease